MKKAILLFTLLISASLAAQGVEFGVKAGVSFPNLSGDMDENLSGFTTYHAGAFANIEVSDSFSVQPECMFSCQGADYEESEGYDGRFEFAYINVPIMAQVEVADGLCLEAGPQIGFLLSAEDQYEGITFDDEGTDDISNEISSVDFGVNFGASYEFAEGFAAGARYNLGLSNVVDSSDFDGKLRNNVIQIFLAYTIFGSDKGDDDED